MLSVERCRKILNEHAPPGVTYASEEAEKLRGVLYLIARIGLETSQIESTDQHDDDEDAQEGTPLYPRLYRRAG